MPQTVNLQNLANFGHQEGHQFQLKKCDDFEILVKRKFVAGLACQWPMTARGHVTRLVRAQIHQVLVEGKTSYSKQVTQACKGY
jgi:hypothetical protein